MPGLHEAVMEFVLGRFGTEISILDCGAGTGAWVEGLQGHGFRRVWAVDVDAAEYAGSAPFCSVDLNRDFAAEILSAKAAPPAGGFDLITGLEVIEHLENPSHFLRQCRQLLREEGCLLLTTPNVECAPGRLKFLAHGQLRHFDRHGDPTHLTPVFSGLLEKMAAKCGFRVVERRAIPRRTWTGSRRLPLVVACGLARLARGHVWGDCTLYLLHAV